jgi:hypothetical protein
MQLFHSWSRKYRKYSAGIVVLMPDAEQKSSSDKQTE